jgi:cytochrome c oxidase cbb3-type subunit 1
MISIGAIYHLIPALFGHAGMYSVRLVNTHFWLHTVGVVLYIVAMWISGVMQGLMWRAVNADGTLMYSFVQSLEASKPFYIMRFLGGVFIVTGMLVMAYNTYRTVTAKSGSLADDAKAQLA